MKQVLLIATLLFVANIASAQWEDDMYSGTWGKSKKQQQEEQQQEAYQQSQHQQFEEVQNSGYQTKELIEDFDEALQRRITAIRENEEMDENYWMLMEQYQSVLERKYDENLYNIVVVGKDMWVEPKYITAMFDGSDPIEGFNAYGESVLQNLAADDVQVETTENVEGGSGDVYNIYYVDSVYDVPNFGLYFNWGFSSWWGYGRGGYRGGWYNPWYSPWSYSWYSPWYDPWYGGWYGGWYGPGWYGPGYNHGYRPGYSKPRNSRGVVYGNSSRSNVNSRTGGRTGLGSSRSSFSRADAKPTGVNTVSGLGSRRDQTTATKLPNGSVADNFRNNTGVVANSTDRRGNSTSSNNSTSIINNRNNRNNNSSGNSNNRNNRNTVDRNNNSNSNSSSSRNESNSSTTERRSYERTNNNSSSRSNFESPVSRPTTTNRSTSTGRSSSGSSSSSSSGRSSGSRR
ncbi:MAG: hypothetical protein R3Y61_02575 [Rikenellaceae bacterium]